MTEPCDLSAVEARALIGRRRLSPVELLDSCIARIEAVDPAVNAMVALDLDRARDTARKAEAAVMRGEALGALHGLPLGVKDLSETAGLRTTFGSPMFRDHVPQADSGFVRRLREAGAVVLGKTNTPEFGAGANTRNKVYGTTGNPFAPSLSAAGSSGGSAVALACGMVPIATGSDTGGSLRNPASFSGVVGFRPSPGLVPGQARPQGWSGLPVFGPMARSVPDACLLLSAMAADDPLDPLSAAIPGRVVRQASEFWPMAVPDLSRLRVAFTADLGFAPVESGVRRAFERRIKALEGVFARLEPATPDCSGADEAFEVLRAVGFLSSHLQKVRERPGDVGPNVSDNVAEGLRYSAEDVARALSAQTALFRRWGGFFAGFDLVLTPSITVSPRPWTEWHPALIDGAPTRSYFHWLALAYAVTLAGHPASSVPTGLDERGMPFGLQVIGPRGGDAIALGASAGIEALFAADPSLRRPVPNIAALRAAAPISGMDGFMP